MNRYKQISRLLVFAEVAKQGGFTAAARELNVSKSAVSQQVQSLENELGIQLLSRTTRGIKLTALGERIRLRCQNIEHEMEGVFADLANAQNNPRGVFSITFPHSLEEHVVIPAIERLCAEFPGIEPELYVTDESIDLVTNHLDLAVRAGELADSGYRALPLGKLTEIFCATPLFLQRSGLSQKEFTWDKLSDYPWIASSWQKNTVAIIDIQSQETRQIKLNIFAKVNTLPSVLNLTLKHMGIALLPDLYARPYLLSSELVPIATSVTGPLWPLYSVHTYQTEKPIHVTRFHQLLQGFIANQHGYDN